MEAELEGLRQQVAVAEEAKRVLMQQVEAAEAAGQWAVAEAAGEAWRSQQAHARLLEMQHQVELAMMAAELRSNELGLRDLNVVAHDLATQVRQSPRAPCAPSP